MAAACRCMNNGFPVSCPHMLPCGPANSTTGFVQCCYGIDTCGADLFCLSAAPKTGETGYYAGGCTDATYRDDSCSKQCGSQIGTQAIYSPVTGNWSCCFDNAKGASDCSAPTNITFEAPSPDVLFKEPFSILTASPTGSSSSTFNQNIQNPTTPSIPSTATQTVTTTATTTATASADSSSGLSTDARAGIGVGVAVLGIIVLGVLLVWWRRSRRRRRQQQQQPVRLEQPFMPHDSMSKALPYVGAQQFHEVDGLERRAEM